jgi:hypothetical protein
MTTTPMLSLHTAAITLNRCTRHSISTRRWTRHPLTTTTARMMAREHHMQLFEHPTTAHAMIVFCMKGRQNAKFNRRMNRYPCSQPCLVERIHGMPTEFSSNPYPSYVRLRSFFNPFDSYIPADMFRTAFKFGVFNAMQSSCIDGLLNTDDNMVCAVQKNFCRMGF